MRMLPKRKIRFQQPLSLVRQQQQQQQPFYDDIIRFMIPTIEFATNNTITTTITKPKIIIRMFHQQQTIQSQRSSSTDTDISTNSIQQQQQGGYGRVWKAATTTTNDNNDNNNNTNTTNNNHQQNQNQQQQEKYFWKDRIVDQHLYQLQQKLEQEQEKLIIHNKNNNDNNKNEQENHSTTVFNNNNNNNRPPTNTIGGTDDQRNHLQYNNTNVSHDTNGDMIRNSSNNSNKSNTSSEIDYVIQQIIDTQGSEMRQRGLGVLHADPVTDIQLLTDNYTVKAVASALRDREDSLQRAALLATNVFLSSSTITTSTTTTTTLPTATTQTDHNNLSHPYDMDKIQELLTFLQIFHPKYVLERRKQQKSPSSDLTSSTDDAALGTTRGTTTTTTTVVNDPVTSLASPQSRNVIRKALMRMPRTVTTAHSKRAGVCLALCLCDGIPSILLERRAYHLRNHPGEVCFPGGMVCDIQDQTIVDSSLREMNEEIHGLFLQQKRPIIIPNNNDNTTSSSTPHQQTTTAASSSSSSSSSSSTTLMTTTRFEPVEVLGILRLNWGEVQYLTGVAVTPVVCYVGELPEQLQPNPDEVAEVFTIPLRDLLNRQLWIHRENLAPIYIGGPHVIWGLTGYILERFAKDILVPTSSI